MCIYIKKISWRSSNSRATWRRSEGSLGERTMKAILQGLLLLGWLCRASRSASCDRHLLPELSFGLSGSRLSWPCEATRRLYESAGRHVPGSSIATRAQIRGRSAFLALPRYRAGVPVTLGLASLRPGDCEPRIRAFPCWSMQEEGDCTALQSAVDLVLDAQELLWVLDAGIVNTLEQPVRRCPPKVVAFDVDSGEVVKLIDLSEFVSASSKLQHLVVDYTSDGQVFLYISDASERTIIVYDATLDEGHRVVLPEEVALGCSRDDVLYLALVRRTEDTPILYLTYLGATGLYSIETDSLRRGEASVVHVGQKPDKLVLLGTDNGVAIFFRRKGQSDVYMWNTEAPFDPENFLLVQKGNKCRLPTQVLPGYKRLMWVIESNFHDYIRNTIGCTGASVSLHPLVKSLED